MLETNALGEVVVGVSADLTELEKGFAKAKEQAKAVERDMKRLTAGEWSKIHTERLNKQMTDRQRAAVASIAGSRRQADASRALTRQYEAEARATSRLTDQARRHSDAMRSELLLTNRLARPGAARRPGGGGPPIIVPPLRDAERGLVGVGQAASTATLFMKGFIGVIGVDTARRLAASTVEILKNTAAIKTQAQAIGISTTQYQEWMGIASQLGIEQQDMASGLNEFAENARRAASGAEREAKLFDLLGVKLKDAGGNARSTNDILLDTINRLGEVHNPLQRGAGLAEAFSEAVGPKMAKLIDAGSAKIDELRIAVHEMGMVLGEDQIQKADETARKLEQVKNVLNTKIAGTVIENAGAIDALADALLGVASAAISALGRFAQFVSYVKNNPVEFAINPFMATSKFMGQQMAGQSGAVRGMNKAGSSVTIDLAPAEAKKTGGRDLSGLLAPKGRKGRGGGKSAPDNIFDREELQAQQARLRLLQQSTVDLGRINQIEHELIGLKLKESLLQIDKQVKDGRLTAAQGRQLKAAEEANAQLEREAADRQMRSDMIEQQASVASEILDAERDMLDVAQRLARTDEERTRIDAALLKNKQDQELLEIDKQIALAKEVEDQKRIAELVDLRRRLLEKQGAEVKAFAVENLRGIEKFRNDLPKTVKEINEQIENIRFDLFTEKLQEAARFAEDVGDAFGRAAGRIANFENPLSVLQGLLQDLSQTLTEQFIVKPVSDFATEKIGVPLAKRAFKDELTGPNALTVQQMNMALDLATQNLHSLSRAAMAASGAMGGGGAGAGATQAADALTQAASGTEQSFAALDPQLSQFGNGLMQVLSGLAGGGGGGGLASFLKMGLSIAGSAVGGGMGGFGAGAGAGGVQLGGSFGIPGGGIYGGIDPMFLGGIGGFAEGGWVGGHGTGTSDSMLNWNSVGEHITNASAARAFAPVLDGINSGRIPSMPALGQALGGGSNDNRSFQFGDFNFPNVRDARDARQAERHMTSTIQRKLGMATRAGYRQQP